MVKKLDPNDKIPGLKDTFGDYWAWAYSDILSNRNRGIFAEFLVSKALDVTAPHRKEYDCVDIRYRGKTIEVKCSAYIQSWPQNKLSEIKYSIGRKKVDVGSEYEPPCHKGETGRFADCYVFCLYIENDLNKDKAIVHENVLNFKYWEFYVLPTKIINDNEDKEYISLSKLKEISTPVTSYFELKACIDSVLGLD